MARIALGIEYDGTHYFGWQRQREVVGVQQRLEQVLSSIADEPVEIFCAGRTDAGVHATGQVIHFDTDKERSQAAWTLGANSRLPDDIAVRWATEVDDEFHARFTATARRYRYIIYNARMRPGILRRGVSHYHQDLDVESMRRAAPYLIGEHDFTSFRAIQCQSHSPNRNVTDLNIIRRGAYIIVDIRANAFLHHMVRNIVGTLLVVGRGEQPAEWVKSVLEARDRTAAGATAKPNGLYLVDVTYPEQYPLPKGPMGPLFLDD